MVLQAECEKVKTAADGSVGACKYTPLPAAYSCNSMGVPGQQAILCNSPSLILHIIILNG